MNSKESAFVSSIEKKVEGTIKKYRLLNKKEKILVAASGGKDSTAAMFILKKLGYNIIALTVDVEIGSYTKINCENLKRFCGQHKIPLYVLNVREEFGCSICYMQSALKSKGMKLNSCAVCGVIRRYMVNRAARKLGAKKIVTGHNLDDEAQSMMMNLFRNTLQLSARLGPSAGVMKNSKFIPRIKPLYFIPEKDIVKYSKLNRFPVNYEKCPCSVFVFRNFVRQMLNEQEKSSPGMKRNIVEYFLKIQPALRKRYKGQSQAYCTVCGEPSQAEVCRACQIIGEIKKV